jgi:hypothetical protein
MRKPLATLAALASASLVMAACAMPADDPNFTQNTGVGGDAAANAAANEAGAAALDGSLAAPTSIGVDVPLAAAPEAGAVIISLTDGSGYEAVVQDAMAAAASALGWTVESITVDPADPTAVATAFDEALAKKPSGIHLRGEFFDAVSMGLPAAESAGIPVVCTGCSGDPSGAIKDTSIDGTVQNSAWGVSMAAYVVASQYSGEGAGVQVFTTPGGAVNDFNNVFDTTLLSQCRECSTTQSLVDSTMVDVTDPAAVAAYITSEMTISLGAWALLDSGAQSAGVSEALATDPTLLAPVVLIGRGASAADIQALQGLGSAVAPASPTAEEASTGRTPEQAAALQAWLGIPLPVLGWRVIDQFARILGGEALADGPLPSQLLTAANAADAVVDDAGNFIGIADYEAQFAALWGIG